MDLNTPLSIQIIFPFKQIYTQKLIELRWLLTSTQAVAGGMADIAATPPMFGILLSKVPSSSQFVFTGCRANILLPAIPLLQPDYLGKSAFYSTHKHLCMCTNRKVICGQIYVLPRFAGCQGNCLLTTVFLKSYGRNISFASY